MDDVDKYFEFCEKEIEEMYRDRTPQPPKSEAVNPEKSALAQLLEFTEENPPDDLFAPAEKGERRYQFEDGYDWLNETEIKHIAGTPFVDWSTIDVFKVLPKINCRECGEPTCLAFAMRVVKKEKNYTNCPHLLKVIDKYRNDFDHDGSLFTISE